MSDTTRTKRPVGTVRISFPLEISEAAYRGFCEEGDLTIGPAGEEMTFLPTREGLTFFLADIAKRGVEEWAERGRQRIADETQSKERQEYEKLLARREEQRKQAAELDAKLEKLAAHLGLEKDKAAAEEMGAEAGGFLGGLGEEVDS